MTNDDPAKLAEEGKRAFQNRQFDQAADFFRRASEGYTLDRAGLLAAEMQNNLSVALLQGDKPKEALEAVLGTDQIFAGANDLKRQGMALGNQAAALEALKRTDEALAAYERAAEIFNQVGEGDLRAMVKKSAAAIRLKRGQVGESALNMIGSIEAKEKPSFFERILKFLVRLKPW
jgi:tetratricopeptide (TPR) repeat protein